MFIFYKWSTVFAGQSFSAALILPHYDLVLSHSFLVWKIGSFCNFDIALDHIAIPIIFWLLVQPQYKCSIFNTYASCSVLLRNFWLGLLAFCLTDNFKIGALSCGETVTSEWISAAFTSLSWPALRMLVGLQTQMRGLSLAALLQLQPPSVAHGHQLTAVFSLEFVKYVRITPNRKSF